MSRKIREGGDVLRRVFPEGKPILPIEGEDNVLITSALPYCNNVPHLGNVIGSTLSADVFARYNRGRNKPTIYICGTDEYGTATETQASKEKCTPQELCDKYRKEHRETYEWFEISFDHFGRTSSPKHTEICQDIYTQLSKNNMLALHTKQQTYCEGCQKFLADRLVEGICPHCASEDARGDQCDTCGGTYEPYELKNPRCALMPKDKTHVIILKETPHMHVRLDALQPRIEEFLKTTSKLGKWSRNPAVNEAGVITESRVKEGLQPSPVTRDLSWGVPVPDLEGDDNKQMLGKVLYVWFDAPIGYPSITAEYTSEWKQWWMNPKNVRLCQFMGKDNVYFHTILFPACIMGDGRDWTMLHHLSSTEYLNYDGGKFSKSRNRGVFGPAAKTTGIPVSVWRFYLLSSRPETSDTMFSWDECIAANNNILLKNFGNFVNRVLSFISKNYDGVIPDGGDVGGPLSPNDELDAEFVSDVNVLLRQYMEAMDVSKLREGLGTIMRISQRGNLYLQASGLNTALMKSDPTRCAQVLSRAANLIYALAALVEPYMPSTARAMLDQLNAPPRAIPEVICVDLLPGHAIGKPAHLFKQIDEKMADVWRAQFKGSEEETVKAGDINADATHVAPQLSKRQQMKEAKKNKAAAAPPVDAGPKSPEVLELEAKVAKQGEVVRALKAKPKSKEVDDQVATEVDVLKKLKTELVELTKK